LISLLAIVISMERCLWVASQRIIIALSGTLNVALITICIIQFPLWSSPSFGVFWITLMLLNLCMRVPSSLLIWMVPMLGPDNVTKLHEREFGEDRCKQVGVRRRVSPLTPLYFPFEGVVATSLPTVDVIILSCGEDPGVILESARAAVALNYPQDKLFVTVSDDASHESLREAVLPLHGCDYFARTDAPLFYKSGNMAAAMEHTSAELVLFLDADMRVDSDALLHLVPYFISRENNDGRLGIVQTPQFHSHVIPGDILDRDLSSFFDYSHRLAKIDVVKFLGTSALFARKALNTVSIRTWNITEDNVLTVELLINGWRGKWHPMYLARGENPRTAEGKMKQRIRWNTGIIQLIRDIPWVTLFTKIGFRRGLMIASKPLHAVCRGVCIHANLLFTLSAVAFGTRGSVGPLWPTLVAAATILGQLDLIMRGYAIHSCVLAPAVYAEVMEGGPYIYSLFKGLQYVLNTNHRIPFNVTGTRRDRWGRNPLPTVEFLIVLSALCSAIQLGAWLRGSTLSNVTRLGVLESLMWLWYGWDHLILYLNPESVAKMDELVETKRSMLPKPRTLVESCSQLRTCSVRHLYMHAIVVISLQVLALLLAQQPMLFP